MPSRPRARASAASAPPIIYFPIIGSTNDVAATLAVHNPRRRRRHRRPADGRPRAAGTWMVLAAGQRPVRFRRAEARSIAARRHPGDEAPDARGGRRAGGGGRDGDGLSRRSEVAERSVRRAAQAGRHSRGGGAAAERLSAIVLGYGINVGPMAISARAARSRDVARIRAGAARGSRGCCSSSRWRSLARRYDDLLDGTLRCYPRRLARPCAGATRRARDAGRPRSGAASGRDGRHR